jgi:uncharacterized membrane protein YsdA (DUF1294 family)
VASLAAAVAMLLDKRRAQQGSRRLSEKLLLWFALVGGTPGTLISMVWCRHKTQKGWFQLRLGLIIVMQGLLLAWWMHQSLAVC